MPKKKRKKNPALFYCLIALNIAASVLVVYALSGHWKVAVEGRSEYEDVRAEAALRSEQLLAEEAAQSAETEPLNAIGDDGELLAFEEVEQIEQMEDADSDIEDVMWQVRMNQPQALVAGANAPGEGMKGITSGPSAASEELFSEEFADAFFNESSVDEDFFSNEFLDSFPTPNPALYSSSASQVRSASPTSAAAPVSIAVPEETSASSTPDSTPTPTVAPDPVSASVSVGNPMSGLPGRMLAAILQGVSGAPSASDAPLDIPGDAPADASAGASTEAPTEAPADVPAELRGDALGGFLDLPTPTPEPTKAPTAAPTPQPTPTRTPGQTPVPTTEPWMERAVHVDGARYTMDFPYFQEMYPDMTAWLYQEGTKIDYPVMQREEDNDYYLNRLYNGRLNKNGSIFLDHGNSREFTDANNYIYGHNTQTGDMFGILQKYKDQAYYDKYPTMLLRTPYSDFQIDVFASNMSLVEDEESWRIKQFKRKADFDAYIEDLKENSFFKSEVTPEWGDQFLVLCTCTNIQHGERYVIYGRMRPIRYGTEGDVGITKMQLDSRPSQSGMRVVGSLGPKQLYAQNDALWSKMRYEPRDSNKKRPFGEGGNAVTTVAMMIANMVEKEELPRLLGYTKSTDGFSFCDHSVNQYFCTNTHAQYRPRTPDEYLRYLPIAIADFTTGNNFWDQAARVRNKDGASFGFIPYITGIYGLELQASSDLDAALASLYEGSMVICLTSGKDGSPFTNGAQYVLLAGADAQHLYIFDSFARKNYNATDSQNLLEYLGPNAVRTSIQNAGHLGLNSFFIFTKRP